MVTTEAEVNGYVGWLEARALVHRLGIKLAEWKIGWGYIEWDRYNKYIGWGIYYMLWGYMGWVK